jgi:hypothetical protein
MAQKGFNKASGAGGIKISRGKLRYDPDERDPPEADKSSPQLNKKNR